MSGIGHVDGPRRILLYGVTGSGKSTLARALAEVTGLPWTDVDAHTWRPGWVAVPDEEQRALFAEVCARDEWVLDTAYRQWREPIVARAELIVALDYSRWVSLQRLLRRTVKRLITREAVCNGNVESLRMALSRESIIAWHFRSFARKRAQIRAWTVDPTAPPVVRLTSPRATSAWLDRVRGEAPARH